MATTGFWPVKGRLKDVLDYAANPDKSTAPEALCKALNYVADSEKTERKMFVSGINCNAKLAYEQMTLTKRRYGKLGGNVAYHGYQSFQNGEVTAEEAHQIGLETAKKMWGYKYEIVVATHLNTENIHNHFCINSVSFVDGKKFKNKIGDHMELRKISDEICREHGKSVKENAEFYKGTKRDYRSRKYGGLTHRDLLRRDIDEAISKNTNLKTFNMYLKNLGYSYVRDCSYAHPSVIAPGWKRAVRLDSLGEEYTMERITERLVANQGIVPLFAMRFPKQQSPLKQIQAEMYKLHKMDGMQIAFAIIIELWRLVSGKSAEQSRPQPLSPALRREVNRLDQTLKEYWLLRENRIDSPEGLLLFIEEKSAAIKGLEAERRRLYNRCRRPKSAEDKAQNQAVAREISAQIKPLREELKTAKAVVEHYPKIVKLLETERDLDTPTRNSVREITR